MKKNNIIIFIISMLVLTLFADTKGEEIARKNFNLPESLDDYSEMTMVLINSRGDQKVRKIKMYSKEGKDGRNTFMEFSEPADVSGTKFLTIGHKEGDDEQRLFLPALGKIRRISSSNNDGKFMGSDIYYYDLEDLVYNDFNFKFLREESYNGMECYVVESTPKKKDTPYSKTQIWINKDDFFAYKRDSYDKSSRPKLLKTIAIVETKTINGVIIATKMVVDNFKDKHKTLLIRENTKLNIGLKDEIFSIKNLNN